MFKTLLLILFLFTSCSHKLGFYTGVGVGQGGVKAKGAYPYSSSGLSATAHVGIPVPTFTDFSLNIRGDKIWVFDNTADIDAASINLRYIPIWFLSVEAGPTIGSFWRKMRASDDELAGTNYDSITHSGKLVGGHFGLQLIPLNFIFQGGIEFNYYFVKSTNEKTVITTGSTETSQNISDGNNYNYYTINAILGLTF